jgi:hypothetical protein
MQKRLDVAPRGGVLFFIVGALIIFGVICLILVVCKRRGRSSIVVVRQCVNISSGKQEWHMIFILPLLWMKVPVLCLLRLNAERKDGSKYLPNSGFDSQIFLDLLEGSMVPAIKPSTSILLALLRLFHLRVGVDLVFAISLLMIVHTMSDFL